MKFTYGSGTRPLDGYTIKRGIGQGGFGEVYYAVSDGGKEVALKLVRSNLEVELRGMAQCLNLKHPNLVALFDIKKDPQGDSWVVMEYVGGESLNHVLNRHPRGLAHDLVQQWFVSLAKSVGHLHDNGIVHRDLKPGNIFIENGLVKVGDYGLSKFISGSVRSAQTQSVGTVHYMAPEISTGNYGKQIDIYAAGIILYEMLTGEVPFQGESAGEILMKHLTATPDLSKLPIGYREIVGMALAKNPAHRFDCFADMARAVEMIGSPVQKAAPIPNSPPLKQPPVQHHGSEPPLALPAELSPKEKVAELSLSLVLAAVWSAMFAFLWWAISSAMNKPRDLGEVGSFFYLMTLASWAVMIPGKVWEQRKGDAWLRRGTLMVLGLGLGVAAAWLNGWHFDQNVDETVAVAGGGLPGPLLADISRDNVMLGKLVGYMAFFAVPFFLMRWWKLTDRGRSRRFSFYPVLLAGVLAYIGVFLWPERSMSSPLDITGSIALTMTAVIIQLVSPWEPPARKPVKKVRLRYA
jgi:serine/threonine protein kinase